MTRFQFAAALGLVLLLAAVVRFYRLGQEDYWLDELHSMGSSASMRATFEAFPFGVIFAQRPRGTELGPASTLSAVWHGMRDDTHPPLFFTLLNLWRRLVGDDQAAVRALPATCSVISIAALALLFRRLGRPCVGIFAACLLALALGHIYMAQQNRQYSQALMFTALSYLALIVAEDREASAPSGHESQKRWSRVLAWSLYSLTLCLCVLTHYFTALALAGQLVYVAVRFHRRTLRHWIAACAGAVGLTILLWGGAFLEQHWIITSQPWLSDTSQGHAYRSLMRVADLPLRLLFQLPPFRIELWRSVGGVLLAGIAIFAAWRKPSREALLMTAWFIVPCSAFVSTDIAFGKQTLNHIRYPMVAVIGLSGLIALAIARLRPRLRYATAVALCVAMLGTLSFPTTSHPHARFAVAELKSRVAPADLIIFDAIGWPADWIPQFFAPMEFYMVQWPNPMLLLREPMSAKVQSEVARFNHIFVVSPRIDALPHPAPQTHRLTAQSGYIEQIGWIYFFERQQGSKATE